MYNLKRRIEEVFEREDNSRNTGDSITGSTQLQVSNSMTDSSDEEVLVPIEDDEFCLDLPSVPAEEPSFEISKNSSCATSSSFQDINTRTNVIPFEMCEDSDSDLVFESDEEDNSSECSSSFYERLSSHPSSTSSMRESLLEFSMETGDEEIIDSVIEPCNDGQGESLYDSVTKIPEPQSPEVRMHKSTVPEPEVVPNPFPDCSDATNEPENEPERTRQSVRGKIWSVMRRSAEMLLREAGELRVIANHTVSEWDRTWTSIDTKYGVSRKVGEINTQYGITNRADEITKEINQVSIPITQTTTEIVNAVAKVAEIIKDNIWDTVDILKDQELHVSRIQNAESN